MILLVHSMGNIVLRELALMQSSVLQTKKFETLIVNAADVPWREERPPEFTNVSVADPNVFWLNNVDIAQQQFFHVSYKDTVLKLSRWLFNDGVQRLGRCMDRRRSDNFIFVDFNGTGVNHLFYIDQGPIKFPATGKRWKGNRAIAAYFQTALAGKRVRPRDINGLYDGLSANENLWRFQPTEVRPQGIDCEG